MKNEFVLAFNEVIEDKQLPREVILEALEAAMVSAYRRAVNASNAQQIEASVDVETGKVTIYAEKEVVDAVQDARTEVALKDARKVNKDTAIQFEIEYPKDAQVQAGESVKQVGEIGVTAPRCQQGRAREFV